MSDTPDALPGAEDLRAFDNGGRTLDRYSVTMPDGLAFVMSPNPNHPLGVAMYLEPGSEPDRREIEFKALPERCRRAVISELIHFYGYKREEN